MAITAGMESRAGPQASRHLTTWPAEPTSSPLPPRQRTASNPARAPEECALVRADSPNRTLCGIAS